MNVVNYIIPSFSLPPSLSPSPSLSVCLSLSLPLLPLCLGISPALSPPLSLIPSPSPPPQVIAIYSYEAQGSQELTLVEGSVISVVAKEDDVWWCGQLDGRTGMFPAAYVETYEET